jgi:predicted N-acetyltransferase YhbS
MPSPRSYESDALDLPAMMELVRQRWVAAAPGPADMHPGDIAWQRFKHEDHTSRWFELVRLWDDSDQLVGFSIAYPKGRELSLSLTESAEGDRDLVRQMVDDALALPVWSEDDHPAENWISVAAVADSALESVLISLGASRVEEPYFRMNGQSLTADDVSPASPPAGWAVRPVEGPSEYESRLAVHQAAFESLKATIPAYVRLRSAPGYDPELDLVAVNERGVIASFALGWFDGASGTGLFEPVGTLPKYRRQGLSRAVLQEGLRRFRERGARQVYVNSLEASEAANGVYAAVGFQLAQQIRLYRLDGGATSPSYY